MVSVYAFSSLRKCKVEKHKFKNSKYMWIFKITTACACDIPINVSRRIYSDYRRRLATPAQHGAWEGLLRPALRPMLTCEHLLVHMSPLGPARAPPPALLATVSAWSLSQSCPPPRSRRAGGQSWPWLPGWELGAVSRAAARGRQGPGELPGSRGEQRGPHLLRASDTRPRATTGAPPT